MMRRWLSRPALARARIVPGDREQVIVTDEPDPAVDALVARSAAALDSIAGWPEDQIDALIAALAAQIAAHADELAAATVAETGIGCVPDKAVKNRFASLGVARSLTGKPGVGVAGGSGPDGLTEIAEPMGVIVGLIPVTNPVATLVFKALICIKARDALIASCHRDAAGVGARTADLLRQVLARHGACADLIQTVPRRPTRQVTAALMRHPGVAMILATGGTAMVKAAYSSGTPAIGVGPGNAPAWVCADADLQAAARMVVASKAFDHGIICGSENNLIVDQSVRDDFTAALHGPARPYSAPPTATAWPGRPSMTGTGGCAAPCSARPPRPSPPRPASPSRPAPACSSRPCPARRCRARTAGKSSPRSCRCSPPTARTTPSGCAGRSSATAAAATPRSSTPAASGSRCPSPGRCPSAGSWSTGPARTAASAWAPR